MNRDEILEKVIDIVAETLEVEREELSEDTNYDDLGADSFDKLELVTALEDEFGFELDDDVLETIATVGDSVDAILKAQ